VAPATKVVVCCTRPTANRQIVAFLATPADFFAFAQIAAPHHMRRVRSRSAASRGNAMIFVKRFVTALAAVSMSGAMLSQAFF
jgi:hypothetical protein